MEKLQCLKGRTTPSLLLNLLIENTRRGGNINNLVGGMKMNGMNERPFREGHRGITIAIDLKSDG
jgi:hypothetical protein